MLVGIHTLPAVNEHDPTYRRFIITGEDSVVRHWLRCGASAWRLDVADELPDDFIAEIGCAAVMRQILWRPWRRSARTIPPPLFIPP